ncbi:MAG: hypothetical protein ACOC2H_08410 [Spirochaetota bacterium]
MRLSEGEWICIQSRFDSLSRAVFDSSSLIYIERCELLPVLERNMTLLTTLPVIREVGSYPVKLHVIPAAETEADVSVVRSGAVHNLPVITEDYGIIRCARSYGLVYYNTLMMLCFLLYRRAITIRKYHEFESRLRMFARYSDAVWQYGAEIFGRITGRG